MAISPRLALAALSSFIPLLAIALVSFSLPYWWLRAGLERAQGWPARLAVAPAPTLVIYVYSGSDPEYLANLQFFAKEAIKVRP